MKLRFAQHRAKRTGDPSVLQKAIFDMPGAKEFYTCKPHLEEAEVFGSQKRKPDTSIGADNKMHRPDTMNFSHPRPAKRITRSRAGILPTIIKEASPSMQEIAPPSPTELDLRRITAVQESQVNEKLWHIACFPYTSAKSCWAMQAVSS